MDNRLTPEAISRIMRTIVQGYKYILQRYHPNMSSDEITDLEMILNGVFTKVVTQLQKEGIAFDFNEISYYFDFSTYGDKQGLLLHKMRDFTDAIIAIPFLNEEGKGRLDVSLQYLVNKISNASSLCSNPGSKTLAAKPKKTTTIAKNKQISVTFR